MKSSFVLIGMFNQQKQGITLGSTPTMRSILTSKGIIACYSDVIRLHVKLRKRTAHRRSMCKSEQIIASQTGVLPWNTSSLIANAWFNMLIAQMLAVYYSFRANDHDEQILNKQCDTHDLAFLVKIIRAKTNPWRYHRYTVKLFNTPRRNVVLGQNNAYIKFVDIFGRPQWPNCFLCGYWIRLRDTGLDSW